MNNLCKYLFFDFVLWCCMKNIICRAQDPPINDQCETAIPLTIDGEEVLSSTIGGTMSNTIDIIRCGGDQLFDIGTPGVWFQVTGNDSILRASTCSEETDFQNRITIFTGEDCNSRNCLNTGRETTETCPYTNASHVEWVTKLDRVYYLLVHDVLEFSGHFGLTVRDATSPPENDQCENAFTLTEASVVKDGTTRGASFDAGIEDGPIHPGVWYRFLKEDFDTQIIAQVCSDILNFNVSVYVGEVCGELSRHDYMLNFDTDTTSCGSGALTNSSWIAAAGKEYFLLVHATDEVANMTASSFDITFARDGNVDTGMPSDDMISGCCSLTLSAWHFVLSALVVLSLFC
jgi:hypothetical protein